MISPVLAQPFRKGRWEGDAILTSAGDVKVRVRDENAVGETVIQAVEKGELAKFPIKIRCPGCRQENVAGKNDIFRCMDCNEIYYVDKFGHVISLKPGRARSNGFIRHLEFKIPSDVNYLNHIRNFIVGISSEERINDEKIAQIEMSLDEALANVIEHAYAYDAFQEIHISLTLYPDKLIVVIRDHGRSFDSKNLPLPDLKKHIEERRVGGLGRYLIKTLMDEVEYQSDSYTNELRMVKHF
jgi:anti-sigma regulatory factor (Ser/Thr protein kinase)